ncbi:MAG: hypothetical protein DMG99_07905 [Acidobacteria bacterium]|nr:MAG: hypothetical protein DMG99_07905 [Acidobacteriota bacterium]
MKGRPRLRCGFAPEIKTASSSSAMRPF